MYLNKLKKNYGSIGKININIIGGFDLVEVERGIVMFFLLFKLFCNLIFCFCLVFVYFINEGLIL